MTTADIRHNHHRREPVPELDLATRVRAAAAARQYTLTRQGSRWQICPGRWKGGSAVGTTADLHACAVALGVLPPTAVRAPRQTPAESGARLLPHIPVGFENRASRAKIAAAAGISLGQAARGIAALKAAGVPLRSSTARHGVWLDGGAGSLWGPAMMWRGGRSCHRLAH